MAERIEDTGNKVFTGTVDLESLQNFFDVLSAPDLEDVTLPDLRLFGIRSLTPTYYLRHYIIDDALQEKRVTAATISQDFDEGTFSVDSIRSIIEARQEVVQKQKSVLRPKTFHLDTTTDITNKKWLIAFGKLTISGSDINALDARGLVEPVKNKGYYFTTRKRRYDHRQPS